MSERIPTHVPNLDEVLGGGLPAHSVVLISGVPGSGKTVLANQILYGNSTPENKGLFISSLSEPLACVIRYSQNYSFFDIEKVNRAVFYEDLGSLLVQGNGEKALARIEELLLQIHPAFLIIDSIRAFHDLSTSTASARRGLFRLVSLLSTLPCTALLIGEYQHNELTRTVEASIADVIIYMDNRKQGPYTQRVLSVHKMRGHDYIAGEHSFYITRDGLTVFPRFTTPSEPLKYAPSNERVPTGIPGFDTVLLPGGILRGTTTLVAGDPGIGKTVTALHFLLNGARQGEPGVYTSFQEDPNQLAQIARNFGHPIDSLKAENRLMMLYTSPVSLNLDEYAAKVVQAIRSINARRVVIDSVNDLSAATYGDDYRFFDFVYSLVQWFKDRGITAMLTTEMGQLFANELTLTGRGISHIADNIILMRYTELAGEIRRALTLLAARGSDHSKKVYEYLISEAEGPCLGAPLSSAFNLFSATTRQEQG